MCAWEEQEGALAIFRASRTLSSVGDATSRGCCNCSVPGMFHKRHRWAWCAAKAFLISRATCTTKETFFLETDVMIMSMSRLRLGMVSDGPKWRKRLQVLTLCQRRRQPEDRRG